MYFKATEVFHCVWIMYSSCFRHCGEQRNHLAENGSFVVVCFSNSVSLMSIFQSYPFRTTSKETKITQRDNRNRRRYRDSFAKHTSFGRIQGIYLYILYLNTLSQYLPVFIEDSILLKMEKCNEIDRPVSHSSKKS